MKKLTPQAIKILKMFHLFFAFCWVISALILCGLFFMTHPESGDELYMRCSEGTQTVNAFLVSRASCVCRGGCMATMRLTGSDAQIPYLIDGR